MGYCDKSPVGLGQFLNSLTRNVSEGAPIPVALDLVKGYFGAEVVALEWSRRQSDCVLIADSAFGGSGDAEKSRRPSPVPSATLRSLAERYSHVTASDPGSREDVGYTMWVFRDRDAPRFDNEETALAGIVVSQLAIALEIVSRIDAGAAENALYLDALERLHVGVLVVDDGGTIDRMSDVAARVLEERDGLQVQSGKLRASNCSENRELQAMIRAAALAPAGDKTQLLGLALTKSSGARTLGVMVRPIESEREAPGLSLAAIFLRDSEAELDVDTDFFKRILDLTPAEAALTGHLASGLSLEEAAVVLRISRNTARAHLRSIFSKNGVTRQPELVRMVLNGIAPLGGRSVSRH